MSIDRRIFLKRVFLLIGGDLLSGCGAGAGGGDEGSPVADVKLAPFIKTQPSDKSVFSGESAIFHVVVEGSEPFSYQWRKDAIKIAGAVSSSYATPPLELADTAASYSVEVANRFGAVISRNAVLTVTRLKVTADQTSISIDSSQITIDRT